jgi:hypothetical protein
MKRIPLEVQLAFYALIALTIMMVASLAQSSPTPERPRRACAADYKQFCPDVKLGEGRAAQCLKSHASELSGQCKAALQAAQAARAAKAGKAPTH